MKTGKKFNSNIKLIAFDADDTLWENELHYRRAEVANLNDLLNLFEI